MSELEYTPVKCTRCRFVHLEGQRISRPRPRRSTADIQISDTVCPRCGCKSFYDQTPQVAWCWASGLIEIGDQAHAAAASNVGCIEIAQGPKSALATRLSALARHGKGASAGKLLVPGVPEVETQQQKGDALATWLKWCRSRPGRDGVTFSKAG